MNSRLTWRKFRLRQQPSTAPSNSRPSVAIISAPKSASTFVFQLLQQLFHFEPVNVLQTDGGRPVLPEADLGTAARIRESASPAIMMQHLAPNANTLRFLELSRMHPVIIWRDLEDSMVSLCEEWERQWNTLMQQIEADGFHLQFLGAVPLAFIKNFIQADQPERYDMTIDLALPWYCQFVSGWSLVRQRHPELATFLTFEQITQDEVETVRALVTTLGATPERDIATALAELKKDKQLANLNIGLSGRGQGTLTLQQRHKIEAMKQAYRLSIG